MEVKSLNDVARILDASRVRQGLTKSSLVKYSGVSRPTLLKIINEGKNPNRDGYQIDSLFKVAEAIGVKIILEENLDVE